MIPRTLLAMLAALALSTSASAQWQIEPSHTQAGLRGISAVSNEIAWASGTNGTILRTLDGGATWLRCAVPAEGETLDFRAIRAASADAALAMSAGPGTASRLYLTSDGCKSWTLLLTNHDKEGFWDGLVADDALTHAFIIGDQVNGRFALLYGLIADNAWIDMEKEFRTDLLDALLPVRPTESLFAASNSVLAGDVLEAPQFITGGKDGAYFHTIARDTIKGRILPLARKLPLAQAESAGAFSMAKGCTHSGKTLCTLVIVGGDYKQPEAHEGTATLATLANLHTAPDAFRAAAKMPHGYRSAVAFDENSEAFIAVGPNGTDISRDGGLHWEALAPLKDDSPNSDKRWNALSLPFAVGPDGRIGKLEDEALVAH